MMFSNPRFLLFVVALLAVLSAPLSVTVKKRILTAGSCLFYACWDWRYLGLLLFVGAVDYECARRIHATENVGRRKAWLLASVASNLGILSYFKYYNFFVTNYNHAFGSLIPISLANIILPAGISFYTFKSMSYTIDVHRREIEPCRSIIDYAMFITFFPELIAGPIVRASVFLPQMSRVPGPTWSRLRVGASMFLHGLTKKLVVADRLAGVVDPVFADPALYSGGTLLIAVLSYAVQIYADFSGYSDMAIGIAKMIGYELPENFDMPYASTSPAEFWRRWHITLSRWLRDYVYIPLGGNRSSEMRTYVNLAATMLLGGLWHGASWNFVLWGGLHGVGLAVHRYFGQKTKLRIPGPLAWMMTTAFVVLCWIPFRAPTFGATKTVLWRMLTGADGAHFTSSTLFPCIALVAVGHVLGVLVRSSTREQRTLFVLQHLLGRAGLGLEVSTISGPYLVLHSSTFPGAFWTVAWSLFIFYFASVTSNPFIYFQF